MRNFRSLSLAVAGLVGLSSSSATAGLNGVDTTNAGQPRVKVVKHKHKKSGYICADCQARMIAESGAPAPMMISGTPSAMMAGPCTACETAGPAMIAPSAPGYASVGDGSPAPVYASAGNAPGLATVGGPMVASSEPTPIGVVRTNYSVPPAAGTLEASLAGQQQGMPAAGPIPYAKPNEIPAGMLGAPHRRPRIFSRIIGLPDFGRARAESQARARETHAMTTYGASNSAPSNLPASMVYGK